MLSNFEEALGFKLEASNLLYVLCDYETLLKKNISIKQFIDLCKNKNVKLIQYRDKISSLNKQKENLILLKENLDVPILINDKIELIEFCDGFCPFIQGLFVRNLCWQCWFIFCPLQPVLFGVRIKYQSN